MTLADIDDANTQVCHHHKEEYTFVLISIVSCRCKQNVTYYTHYTSSLLVSRPQISTFCSVVQAIRRLNCKLLEDNRVYVSVLANADGLSLAVKK